MSPPTSSLPELQPGPSLARQNERLLAAIRVQQDIAQPGIDGLEIMRRVAEQVRVLLGADVAAVAVPTTDGLEYSVIVGDVSVDTPFQVSMDGSLAGCCYRQRASVRCGDVLKDPRISNPMRLQFAMRSALVVPLIYRDDCFGVLSVSARTVNAFDADDHCTTELFGGILGAALSNAAIFAERQLLLTERTAALEQLRASEELFRALTENTDEMLSVLDANGAIRFVSRSSSRVIGYEPHELVGVHPGQLVHPDDLQRLTEAMAALSAPHGVVGPTVVRMRHKDGGWRYVEGAGRNLMHVPAVRGLVTNARDITARRQLEAELRQAQKMDAVGQLAGGVAHDFNNILTAITSYCDMLIIDLEESHPARSDVLEIRTAARRAADLTRQLLAFSRKQVMDLEVFDATRVVRQMHNMLARLIGENIVLETSYPDEPLPIRADRIYLEQVIMNLAVNARDAMPAGGRLRISLARADLAEGEISDLEAGSYLMVRVGDDGCGMSDEVRGRIFEPFFTTKGVGQGSGLGLSVVYGIVTQFRGSITVTSEPAVGTEFTIHLPLATRKPKYTAAEPQTPRRARDVWPVSDAGGATSG